MILPHVHTTYLDQIHPLYPSLSVSLSLLKTISMGFTVLFSHMGIKCFDHMYPLHLLLLSSPLH
jgi:hypothetical protein